MNNPYSPDDRANGRLAWAEGFQAGADAARDLVVLCEGCACGCNQGAWLDWSEVSSKEDEVREEA